MVYYKVQKLLKRSDFQQNPLQAMIKRLGWRLHWKINTQPFVIPFAETLKIVIPKTGSGAGIYYQGFSEPTTADLFIRFLRPKMVVIDIGAHIGEYTLLAAKVVGDSGQVHSFEPQSHLFSFIKQSVELNGFQHVVLDCSAVSDYTGNIEFQVFDEPTLSSIRKQNMHEQSMKIVSVPCISLDNYWTNKTDKIDLIKVDVEGAEKFVLQGAVNLLALPPQQAPTWIFEYAPNSYADFGYQSNEILQLFKQYGYIVFQYCGLGNLKVFDPNLHLTEIVNLVATKDKEALFNRITDNQYSPVYK